MGGHLIAITHCQIWDDYDGLLKSIKSAGSYPIVIVDDSGSDNCNNDYYKSLLSTSPDNSRINIIINKENVKSYLSRYYAAIEASNRGFDTIQYIDSGDELIVDGDYDKLVGLVRDKYDLGIYPQLSIIGGEDRGVYYSRIGTTTDSRTIQKSLLERSLSCSQCMKVYRVSNVLKAYSLEPDLKVFDLEDYAFNLLYALDCKSVISSLKPHYKYYLNGRSNSADAFDVNEKYRFTKSWLPDLVRKYYYDKFPLPILNYWIDDRLESYYRRQLKNYIYVQ